MIAISAAETDHSLADRLMPIHNRRRWQMHPPPRFPPVFAQAWGYDQYGLWYDLSLASLIEKPKGLPVGGDNPLIQRMRWITPGTFSMGSPYDEDQPESIEKPHQVTLIEGFWLAETASPQGLWKALTGDNPSFHKGLTLPVERVSWDDIDQVLRNANGYHADLNLTLPTEAQWEYACRTGTRTPFHTGRQLTTEQANYNGRFPYGDTPEGIYRGRTVPVKSFEPNPWGLYQMHGNVWEWCKDRSRSFDNDPGVEAGWLGDKSSRVLRGGCWFGGASFCRSASRHWEHRDLRHNCIGFRFAQVASAPAQGASSTASATAAEPAWQPLLNSHPDARDEISGSIDPE